jgi:hypothetical protein
LGGGHLYGSNQIAGHDAGDRFLGRHLLSILLQDIAHNAAGTDPLCGIVWAEKLLETTGTRE